MDKDKIKEIIQSYDETSIIDEDNGFEDVLIHFVFNHKDFYIETNIETPYLPKIYTSDKNDYPHYLNFEKGIGLRAICLLDNKDYINSIKSDDKKYRLVLEKLFELETFSKDEIVSEYLKEFPVYWDKTVHSKNILQLFLSNPQTCEWLHAESFGKDGFKMTRLSSIGLFFNDEKNKNKTIDESALFLQVINCDNLYPPLNGKSWGSFEINDIINNTSKARISKEAYEMIKEFSFSKKALFLVLEINNYYVACRLEFKNSGTRKLNEKIQFELTKVIPYKIMRCDYSFLSSQIGNSPMLLNKRILLIGCGSLGSYIAEEMIKSGCTSMTIFDKDYYEPENICRHKLPFNYIHLNKSFGLSFYLNNYHPQINIISKEEFFSTEHIETINNYDLIISTIGSSDNQLLLNKQFVLNFTNKPVLYVWLEGDGETSHALCSFNNKTGCYNCCFTNDEGKLINNKFNAISLEKIKYRLNCCGGTRIEYGTATLLTATYITMLAIKDIFSDQANKSFIYHFKDKKVIKDDNFLSKGCCFCNAD